MLRSMYSGISGLKNFQTKLDVVGNNIANVSTPGYKKGRVTFQETMSQMSTGAQEATGNRGGVNAAQIGLGAQQGTIDNIHTQGFRQTTNNPLDLAIQGDGYFVVRGENAGDPQFFTRAGNFYLDEAGYIVNSEGLYLLDSNEDPILIDDDLVESFNITPDGSVQTVLRADGSSVTAAQITLAFFANPSGLIKDGSNLYRESPNSGEATLQAPQDNNASQIISNALEMSNVDLAEEFTEMISAQRGFRANTRIITTSDEILQELVNLKR